MLSTTFGMKNALQHHIRYGSNNIIINNMFFFRRVFFFFLTYNKSHKSAIRIFTGRVFARKRHGITCILVL